MRLRKDVNVFLHVPSAKFLQIVVELKNVPGALQDLLGVLRNLNINVLTSFTSVDAGAETGVWSGFAEGAGRTASELKRAVSTSRFVVDSIVTESKEGVLVDAIHFPLTFNTGDRAIMMRSMYITRMLAAVRKQFGSGGDVIVYEEGRSYGKDVASYYLDLLGKYFVRSNLPYVLKLYQALGWFRLDDAVQSKRDSTITISTGGCFECEGVTSPRPYSQFVRGHLGGAISVFLGEELRCEESKCTAKGDKSCEFLLKPES
jgi:predicted hydrocarbon binding protein